MKLAEALLLRGDLQKKLASLRERIVRNGLVQEGNAPHEDPNALLLEAAGVIDELEALVTSINGRDRCDAEGAGPLQRSRDQVGGGGRCRQAAEAVGRSGSTDPRAEREDPGNELEDRAIRFWGAGRAWDPGTGPGGRKHTGPALVRDGQRNQVTTPPHHRSPVNLHVAPFTTTR